MSLKLCLEMEKTSKYTGNTSLYVKTRVYSLSPFTVTERPASAWFFLHKPSFPDLCGNVNLHTIMSILLYVIKTTNYIKAVFQYKCYVDSDTLSTCLQDPNNGFKVSDVKAGQLQVQIAVVTETVGQVLPAGFTWPVLLAGTLNTRTMIKLF